jgi:hypothetical protein
MKFYRCASLLTVAATCALTAPSAIAFDREEASVAQETLSRCAAFFSFVQVCTAQTKPSVAETYATMSRSAEGAARIIGTHIGMNKAAIDARLMLAAKNVMQTVDGDCINISALFAEHMPMCPDLLRIATSGRRKP